MFPSGSIYIENKIGPSTEPCGTPWLTLVCTDDSSLICMNCNRSEKYDLNQFRAVPLMLINCSSLCNKIWWSIVSNAAVRSNGDHIPPPTNLGLTYSPPSLWTGEKVSHRHLRPMYHLGWKYRNMCHIRAHTMWPTIFITWSSECWRMAPRTAASVCWCAMFCLVLLVNSVFCLLHQRNAHEHQGHNSWEFISNFHCLICRNFWYSGKRCPHISYKQWSDGGEVNVPVCLCDSASGDFAHRYQVYSSPTCVHCATSWTNSSY